MGLPGCAERGPEPVPYLDLVTAFPAAAARTDTGAVVFGTPEGRHHLVSGWAGDELDAKRDRTYVWSTGQRSVLRFERIESGELGITLTCRPWRRSDGRAQTIDIELNDEPVSRLEMEPGLNEYQVTLPAASMRAGENLLSFRYGAIRTNPDERGERDRRSLGAAWYRVDFGGPDRPAVPAADAERRQLFVPYGSEVAFVTYLRPETTLAASAAAFRGTAGTASLLLETDRGGIRQVGAFTESTTPRFSVAGEAADGGRVPGRVILRAVADDPATAHGGLVLSEPRLRAPAVAGAESTPTPQAAVPATRPNIVFYLIDTLRADRVGAYGYDRPITPNLDAFAESAVLFERGIGQSSWTRASIASMFTGMWPGTHGAIGRRDKLAPEASTLAEALQSNGYRTAAFITNPNVERVFGFGQGFDDFLHIRGNTSSIRVNRRVFQWLENNAADQPFFLYIHTVDPHDPYLPPDEYLERFASESAPFMETIAAQRARQQWEPTEDVVRNLNALYDAEIAFNDDSFGKLVDDLRRRGLYDDALILVISDHGEEFQEHGRWTHGKGLNVETLDFPLLVKFPGQTEGVRTGRPVEHIDVMPTLLEVAGAEAPASIEGRSFARWARDPRAGLPPRRPVFSHLHLDGPLHLAVVDDGWKLIERRVQGEIRHSALYHLTEDPQEREDVMADNPVRAALLSLLIEAKLQSQEFALETEEAILDQELEERLRALGYLQ